MENPYANARNTSRNGAYRIPRNSFSREATVNVAMRETASGASRTGLAGAQPWCMSSTRRTNGVRNHSQSVKLTYAAGRCAYSARPVPTERATNATFASRPPTPASRATATTAYNARTIVTTPTLPGDASPVTGGAAAGAERGIGGADTAGTRGPLGAVSRRSHGLFARHLLGPEAAPQPAPPGRDRVREQADADRGAHAVHEQTERRHRRVGGDHRGVAHAVRPHPVERLQHRYVHAEHLHRQRGGEPRGKSGTAGPEDEHHREPHAHQHQRPQVQQPRVDAAPARAAAPPRPRLVQQPPRQQ